MRGQLRQALQAHQRSSRALVALRYFREDWRRKRRIFRPRHAKKMTREQGGLRVAVIGPDGAGKSTIIQQIEDWLSWRLSVETFYMGKSKSLAITRLVKAITHQARRVSAFSCRKLGSSNPVARLARQNQRFWEDTSFLAEGWERVRRYRYSMNEAAAGVVILYDRYPLEGVQVFGQPVDGPRIIARRSGSVSWLERRFAAVEESLYRQILAPEQLIALHVSPEISQARKPEHGLEMVTGKALALDEASLVLPGVSIVQADEPLPQVVAQVKSILWDSL
jgi:hypothetical protein